MLVAPAVITAHVTQPPGVGQFGIIFSSLVGTDPLPSLHHYCLAGYAVLV
jgi:hypothetical protein